MFKKSIAALSIMLSGVGSANSLRLNPVTSDLFTPSLNTMPHSSRGKSGRVSSKPSGAARLKRAATKRNNIRKHN